MRTRAADPIEFVRLVGGGVGRVAGADPDRRIARCHALAAIVRVVTWRRVLAAVVRFATGCRVLAAVVRFLATRCGALAVLARTVGRLGVLGHIGAGFAQVARLDDGSRIDAPPVADRGDPGVLGVLDRRDRSRELDALVLRAVQGLAEAIDLLLERLPRVAGVRRFDDQRSERLVAG